MWPHHLLGKNRKKLTLQQQQQDFDITAALKTRKPLRKTTMATLMEGMDSKGAVDQQQQQQVQNRLRGRKPSIEIGQLVVLSLFTIAFSVQR